MPPAVNFRVGKTRGHFQLGPQRKDGVASIVAFILHVTHTGASRIRYVATWTHCAATRLFAPGIHKVLLRVEQSSVILDSFAQQPSKVSYEFAPQNPAPSPVVLDALHPSKSETGLRFLSVRLRELWDKAEVTIGGWCTVPNSFTAELMGRAGFDWVCVDTQHGLAGQDVMVQMLQALDISGTPAFVRVTWNEPDLIMRALDSGAQGVIVPMVNSADEARRAVGACRYAPDGYRSWGPIRASLGRVDYRPPVANRDVVCVVMVETQHAVDRLDEILSIPGVDAVYVGPSDLAVSMGLPATVDPTDAAHVALIEQILSGCNRHGVVAGISCGSVEGAKRWRDRGFRMLNVGNDAVYIRTAGVAIVQSLKEAGATAETHAQSGYA